MILRYQKQVEPYLILQPDARKRKGIQRKWFNLINMDANLGEEN